MNTLYVQKAGALVSLSTVIWPKKTSRGFVTMGFGFGPA
jgi:hypothetical protein